MASAGGGKTIFITGATGHVGSVVTEFAIAQGYKVRALSRSEKGDAKLKALGAIPIRGDLQALDVLRSESAQADIVIHLADSFLDPASPKQYEEVIAIDGAAVDALCRGLNGSDRPLVVTSGTLVTAADPNGAETNEQSPLDDKPFIDRIRSERYALSLVSKGIRVIAIRLAPYVYGRGGSGVYLFLKMALDGKQATYVEDGHLCTSTVHVDDAARLYLLAAQQSKPGDIFNATSATNITSRQLAESIGAAVNVPAVSVASEDATAQMGPLLSKFLTSENRASGAKAVRTLGWQPREVSLLDDMATGSYHRVAQDMLDSKI